MRVGLYDGRDLCGVDEGGGEFARVVDSEGGVEEFLLSFGKRCLMCAIIGTFVLCR